MRKTVHKMFFIWQYDEERQWLNAMDAKGMQLVGVGFGKYVFEEGDCGRYNYQLEMLEHGPNHAESEAYIRFMEETGAEYIGNVKTWVYFRKPKADGPFELFSDVASRKRHVRRMLGLICPVTLFAFATALQNLAIGMSMDSVPNICMGIGVGVLSLAITCGIWRLWKEYRKLKQDMTLHE